MEASYAVYSGPLFFGRNPSFVDFMLLACIKQLEFLFGKELVHAELSRTAPMALTAATEIERIPNLEAFIRGGFGGESLMAPSFSAEAALLS